MSLSAAIWMTIGLSCAIAGIWAMRRRRTMTTWRIIDLIQQFINIDPTAEPQRHETVKSQLIELYRRRRNLFSHGFRYCYLKVVSDYEKARTFYENTQNWPEVSRSELSMARTIMDAEMRRYQALNDVFQDVMVASLRETPPVA